MPDATKLPYSIPFIASAAVATKKINTNNIMIIKMIKLVRQLTRCLTQQFYLHTIYAMTHSKLSIKFENIEFLDTEN